MWTWDSGVCDPTGIGLAAVQRGAGDLAVGHQEAHPLLAEGEQPIQRAAPGPTGGGPASTRSWKPRSTSSSSAPKIPARVPKRRKTVPLPRPERSASASMVNRSGPSSASISRAVATRCCRLRAASARSGCGARHTRGWSRTHPTDRIKRGKVRLRSGVSPLS